MKKLKDYESGEFNEKFKEVTEKAQALKEHPQEAMDIQEQPLEVGQEGNPLVEY